MMGVGSTNKDEVKYVNELQQENHRREWAQRWQEDTFALFYQTCTEEF